MLGFRKATLKKFEEINNELNIDQALRKMAKSFVNGKCRHFDETDIYFITGLPDSGKTTFINKFISLQKLSDDGREYLSLDDGNKKLLSTIKNLKYENDDQESLKKQALVVEVAQQNSELEPLMLTD